MMSVNLLGEFHIIFRCTSSMKSNSSPVFNELCKVRFAKVNRKSIGIFDQAENMQRLCLPFYGCGHRKRLTSKLKMKNCLDVLFIYDLKGWDEVGGLVRINEDCQTNYDVVEV